MLLLQDCGVAHVHIHALTRSLRSHLYESRLSAMQIADISARI